MHNYHDSYKKFPTANSPVFGSVFTLILPFVEQDNIRKVYDTALPPTVAAQQHRDDAAGARSTSARR